MSFAIIASEVLGSFVRSCDAFLRLVLDFLDTSFNVASVAASRALISSSAAELLIPIKSVKPVIAPEAPRSPPTKPPRALPSGPSPNIDPIAAPAEAPDWMSVAFLVACEAAFDSLAAVAESPEATASAEALEDLAAPAYKTT
jgi:hypothetical protein